MDDDIDRVNIIYFCETYGQLETCRASIKFKQHYEAEYR